MTKIFDTTNALSLLGSEKEFPVDFDLAWKWLGFSRKELRSVAQKVLGAEIQ